MKIENKITVNVTTGIGVRLAESTSEKVKLNGEFSVVLNSALLLMQLNAGLTTVIEGPLMLNGLKFELNFMI